MSPNDRKYTKSHEWVKLEEDFVVVGISDYAQDAMGDVTFVELPSAGSDVVQGEECGVVESVKAASDIISPLSGIVSEVNISLEDAPELINQDPYEDGWMFKIKKFEKASYKALMDAAEYDASQESDL
jgi:glycine cleavage system H protein